MGAKVQAGTPCRRRECREPYRDHDEKENCPDGKGKFRRHAPRAAGSQSFSVDEVRILSHILTTITKTPPYAPPSGLQSVLRHEAMAGLIKKVQSMKKQVEKEKERREAEKVGRRFVVLEGIGTELELSKVTAVDIEKEAIYLERMSDGKWRLTYTQSLIPDLRRLEALRIVREEPRGGDDG